MTHPTATITADRPADLDAAATTTIAWLESEFPGWDVSVATAAGSGGEQRPLWIARRDGHHPQSELSAAKLHTRLTDYHDREDRRRALSN